MVKGSGFYLFNVQFNLYGRILNFFSFKFEADEEQIGGNTSRLRIRRSFNEVRSGK